MARADLTCDLESALQSLRTRWDAAAATWEGKARNDFQRYEWEPLEKQARQATDAARRLEQAITQVYQACP